MTAAAQSAAGSAGPPAWTRRPANLATAVTAELVERIVRGVHPPGSTLPPEPARGAWQPGRGEGHQPCSTPRWKPPSLRRGRSCSLETARRPR